LRKLKVWASRLLVAVVAISIGAVAQAPAAHAGLACDLGISCGQVYTDGTVGLKIGGWCRGDNLPVYGETPWIGSCQPALYSLVSGADSPAYVEDTDGFQSIDGCVTKYVVTTGGISSALPYHAGVTRVDDRRGKVTSKWIKLDDANHVTITSKTCGSPMTKHYVNTWADARGYQDQWCANDGPVNLDQRCAQDGWLWKANNYFFCKILGTRVSGANNTYNDYWLLTDLDSWGAGRDGRSFVSAYYLSGGYNDTQNNRAVYWDGSHWVDFPNC
jgi:hypothetical protein